MIALNGSIFETQRSEVVPSTLCRRLPCLGCSGFVCVVAADSPGLVSVAHSCKGRCDKLKEEKARTCLESFMQDEKESVLKLSLS